MNEWGLPDWRDPSAYGDTKKWAFMRWRWEFQRRREDVRAFFDLHAEAIYANKVECNGYPIDFTEGTGHLLRPDEPGFVVEGYYKKGFVAYTPLLADGGGGMRFGGVYGLPNPRISDQPSKVISNVLEENNIIETAHGRGTRPVAGECEYLTVLGVPSRTFA